MVNRSENNIRSFDQAREGLPPVGTVPTGTDFFGQVATEGCHFFFHILPFVAYLKLVGGIGCYSAKKKIAPHESE